MNQNKLTFQSENLVVDYITFKFQHLEDSTKTKIANYLFKIGFNSYQESGKLAKPIKEPIFVNSKNQFQVYFVENNSYWDGTLLHFSGPNAARFYSLVQKKYIDWRIFFSAVLSRFDLYYSRNNKPDDKILVTNFLENSHTQIRKTNKNVTFEKNSKGLILKIGNRKSNHYSRIYSEGNSLKFEYEMKGKFLQQYHLLLINNQLEELEEDLSLLFFRYFGKVLPLNYSYLDWVLIKLRPIRKQKYFPSGFKLDYLDKTKLHSVDEGKGFFTFLQFLVYAQTLDYEVGSLGSTNYRQVIFRIKDFLKHTKQSDNYYQFKQLREFFDKLQENSLIKFFSDKHYRSLITIPEVNLYRGKQNAYIAKVWIAEELFYYAHPFCFPDLLNQKLTTHKLQVLFKVIQCFSSNSIEKKIYIEEFFQSYPSTLTNQQKTKMKKYFIQLIKKFEEDGLIDSNYKIIQNRKVYDTDQITTSNISEGFIVYEKLFL